MNSRLSIVDVFMGCRIAKSVDAQKLQWNTLLIVYVEENVTMYNLAMLSISKHFWCYVIIKLFYFCLFVWIPHLKYSDAWYFVIVHE